MGAGSGTRNGHGHTNHTSTGKSVAYGLQSGHFNTGVGELLIRCSHADAAEYGAGGGGVRRCQEEGCRGGARKDSLSRLASRVKEEAAAICRTGGWRGRGASGVLIPGTTVEGDRKTC